MDPVSSVDQLILLLRQRMAERARSAGPARRPTAGQDSARSRSGLERMQALAAVEGLDDRSLKRALVQNLLAERLGAGLINDAQFQQIIDKVTDAIEAEPDASELLGRAVRDLRAQAR